MRIIFIHGFGEKPGVFDAIAPAIGGQQLFIDNWEELGNTLQKDINIITYARTLAAKYSITSSDVVIGHSLGGWVAHHLKHVTGCKAIQLASWTHPDRVILPKLKHSTILWAMRSGLVFHRLGRWFMLRKFYKGKPSAGIFAETYTRLMKGNKNNIQNQMRLILTPVPEVVTVKPDLRIHAKRDSVIRYPKNEECITVSGDHFTLVTHPAEVYEPIVSFLQHAG